MTTGYTFNFQSPETFLFMVICQKEDLEATNQLATKISTQLSGLKIMGGIILSGDLTDSEISSTHFQAQKIICVETMSCLL